MNQLKRRKGRKGQGGFTLIEIIAVLVVLAVMALVAVPAYMDTVTQSKAAAAMQGVAEGQSRLSGYVARSLLANSGTMPTRATVITDANTSLTDAGDYTLVFAGATVATDIDITATDAEGNSATGVWTMPQ